MDPADSETASAMPQLQADEVGYTGGTEDGCRSHLWRGLRLWATNSGPTCSLRGYPLLAALIAVDGQHLRFSQLDVMVQTASGGPYKDLPVTLKRGSAASSLVAYGEGEQGQNGKTCAKWLVVQSVPGVTANRLDVPSRPLLCPGTYGSHQLQVTPYHPASVGPFSHWP